jgi:hypothetical protein
LGRLLRLTLTLGGDPRKNAGQLQDEGVLADGR